ncbi:ABC transporter ATP-binding protein [Streptomyces morookaense]|uniref:ABC transporter ATP-binding protein n=1 Tax=Streptomyces morookaense TaxID=1970 RepID=A0A7Y7B6R1_STRMO|nr:ABC transporter ATP-binding protein [Streptomyces morookaense]
MRTDPTVQHLRIGQDLLRGRRARRKFAAAVILALVATAAGLAAPLLVKEVISSYSRGGSITAPAVLVGGAALGSTAGSAASGYLLARLGEDMLFRIRQRVMAHALRLPVSTVRSLGTGDLVARITSDAMLLRAVVDTGVVQLPLAALTVAFTLLVMATLDWILVLVTAGSFVVAGIAVAFVLKGVRRSTADQQEAVGVLAQQFTAHLSALTTIKAHRSEQHAADRLGDEAAAVQATSLRAARLESLIAPVMGLGQQVALVSVITSGGFRLAGTQLTTPDFAAFLLYLLQLVQPALVIATGMGRLQAGLAARARLNDVLALPQEGDGAVTAAAVQRQDEAAIVFDKVAFAYAGEPVLHHLSFTVPRTGLTALVGPSGAGKSTSLALIVRFMHPTEGTIRVLGRDVREWTLDELRHRIAYVDQQFGLLEGTVRHNLQLGRHQPFDDSSLTAVLETVGLLEDIQALPHGLETVLGRDNDLSGGQRQRMALARALLSDAEIILFDEPTSQLDSINEKRLRAVMDRLAADRTVVIVAHRLSTVQHAHHIVMIADGTATASGTHRELLDRSPLYRELVASQALASG